MDKSCHTYESVMWHTWMPHVTHTWDTWMRHVTASQFQVQAHSSQRHKRGKIKRSLWALLQFYAWGHSGRGASLCALFRWSVQKCFSCNLLHDANTQNASAGGVQKVENVEGVCGAKFCLLATTCWGWGFAWRWYVCVSVCLRVCVSACVRVCVCVCVCVCAEAYCNVSNQLLWRQICLWQQRVEAKAVLGAGMCVCVCVWVGVCVCVLRHVVMCHINCCGAKFCLLATTCWGCDVRWYVCVCCWPTHTHTHTHTATHDCNTLPTHCNTQGVRALCWNTSGCVF